MFAQANGAEATDEKVNILLVDDRPDKLLAHEIVLADLKQNLVRATSGTEALRCLLKQDFAVILLDVNMPTMDGFETASLIRQRARSETTPIIFISAVNDTETHVSRGYSLGAVDYILTPVVPEILRAKIAVFVDLYKKTEEVKRQAEERAREHAARAEAERRQERLAFLVRASNVLAGSLELQETFQNLAKLVVPQLADFCVILAPEPDAQLRPVAMALTDLTKEPKLHRLVEQFPQSPAARNGARHVYQTRKAATCCEMDSNGLEEIFPNEEDREFVRSFGPTSSSAVPIRAGDHVLGAIIMFSFTPARPCGENELSLADELAQRATLALENARLYHVAQESRTEAERANLAKDRFLAMLSHELRTPLTPVLTSLLALEGEDLSDDVWSSLQMIRRNVELEARLIDDLLDLTRISKGKVQLSLEIVDAHLLLRNALEICQFEIDQKHLSLDVHLSAERVQIEADPARMQQIFWNLIKNAVKFTPDGGRLAVRTRNVDGEFEIEVADNGCGIDPETLPKIFDAFEQGERANRGGLGLGLAITKALVETHKGQITAKSPGRDQGATFAARFPLSENETATAAAGTVIAPGERKSLRILLVEDHEDTNRSLTQLLRRRGYYVHPAFDIAKAVEAAAEEEFDVLVSDIGLPDGTGVELMERLRSRRPTFAIALTGFGMDEDIRKSHEGGFDHHLIKPVDLNRLDSIIQQVPLLSQS